MIKNESKPKAPRTTVVLSAVLVLLVLLLGCVIFYPQLKDQYIRNRKIKIYGGMNKELKDGELFGYLQSGRSICFLGDSITHGSLTDGIHWYQPLIPYIKGDISDLSHGGWQVKHLINEEANIPSADVYVIAIGINDVVLGGTVAANTPDEYTEECGQLAGIIKKISPDAVIFFIDPWTFVSEDQDALERADNFREALGKWCGQNGYRYINTDPIIRSVLIKDGVYKYLLNDYHPNGNLGVGLYSYAVLKADHERSTGKSSVR